MSDEQTPETRRISRQRAAWAAFWIGVVLAVVAAWTNDTRFAALAIIAIVVALVIFVWSDS